MAAKPGKPILDCNCPAPISIKLSIKNVVEPQPVQTATVPVQGGQSLFHAMQEYQKANGGFGLKYKDLIGGPYVVEVDWNGKKVTSGEDTFWETLLYNEASKEVKPISLSYIIQPGDNVFLRFSHF